MQEPTYRLAAGGVNKFPCGGRRPRGIMAPMSEDVVTQFIGQVRTTIEAHGLLPRAGDDSSAREALIVGVSGGPDSVALLHAIQALAAKDLAIAPVVAHLHHGLRSAADADQEFVEDLARKLKLDCEVGRADVRDEAAQQGIGIEEAGRLARRRFLADVARRRGARKVALAHQADDRVETVLFHILRGTGIEGLAALGPRSVLDADKGLEIVRPLIEVRRAEILAYLKATGLEYREDESNQTEAYTRNRLRHLLLPAMREGFNPKVDEAILRLAQQAEGVREVLDDVLDETWRRIVRETPCRVGAPHPPTPLRNCHPERSRGVSPCDRPQGHNHGEIPRFAPLTRNDSAPNADTGIAAILIDADDFAMLRPWMQGAILRRAVERLGGGLKHLSADRMRAVLAALLSGPHAGPVELPGGLAALRRREAIRIGRTEDH